MQNENEVDIARSFAGGFLATLVMGFFMSILPQLGLPKTDVTLILASLFNVEDLELGSGIWCMAMATHFLIGGLVVPLLYDIFIYRRFDMAPWARGMLFGMLIFALNQSIMMPFTGLGFFSSKVPHASAMVFESLFVVMVYGGILGGIATDEETLTQLEPGKFDRHTSRMGA